MKLIAEATAWYCRPSFWRSVISESSCTVLPVMFAGVPASTVLDGGALRVAGVHRRGEAVLEIHALGAVTGGLGVGDVRGCRLLLR